MNEIKVRRSALYTPGSNPAVLLKAARSQADVLIFDLEDAVAPDAKEGARSHVLRALADPVLKGRTVVVRVNGLGTPWCTEDIRAVAGSGVAGVLFPKISSAHEAKLAEGMLDTFGAPCSTEMWCMIETPLSILNALSIGQLALRKGSRMSTWVLGTNDLVKDMRARHMPSRDNLLPMLTTALLAARAAGLSILDGVHNDLKDMAGFDFTCLQGRQMGFDGRTLIHPGQVEACHRAYSPTAEEMADAQEVLEAFALPENLGKGVIQVRGRMVELLHADIARQTLAMADAIKE
jgi:citrate lyase subunit beta/citryl-CoA lyase